MHTHLKVFGAVLLVLFLLSNLLVFHSVVGQTGQVDSKLHAANDSVNQAFSDVLDAEKAGANVTSLLSQLNGAAILLAEAEMSYRSGEVVSAGNNADGAVQISTQVSSLAQDAKLIAQDVAQGAFFYAIVFSVGASVVFVLVLLFVWWRIKSNYVKSLSNSKPELTSQ